MFICAILYLLRDSTAISQCKRNSLFRTAPFLHVSANTKIWLIIVRVLMRIAQWMYRYISNPISRLVLFLIRMLIWIISVTKLRIGSLFTTPANHGRFSCHLATQLSVSEVINYKQMHNFNFCVYLKHYVKHPFKIKGYILMNFAIPWKNPGESTAALLVLHLIKTYCSFSNWTIYWNVVFLNCRIVNFKT